METNTQRLIHTFSALADLGQEIANTSDFEEMLRSSFHLLLGSVAIRRGAVAQYDRREDTLHVISARGLDRANDKAFRISRDNERELTRLGGSLTLPEAIAQANALMEANSQIFESAEVELLVPLVVHERLIGVVLLGDKASGEPFTE